MKYYILFFFPLLLGNIVIAQVEILNKSTEYQSYAETNVDFKEIGQARATYSVSPITIILSYKVGSNANDSIYKLTYVNQALKRVRDLTYSFEFDSRDNALSIFYHEIKKVFVKENMRNKNYTSTLKLGDQIISLAPLKLFSPSVMVSLAPNAKNKWSVPLFFSTNEDEIEKLFGITKKRK